MIVTRVLHLYRVRTLPNAGSRTLHFSTRAIDRKHLSIFFQPSEVPEFEGDDAWFECERRGRRWHVLHRVDPDGKAYQETKEQTHE